MPRKKINLDHIPTPSTFDERRALRQASSDARRAIKLLETSATNTFALFRMLKFSSAPLTPTGTQALERLDRAHDLFVAARQALDDAAYQLEEVQKLAK